jgi:hypothetical protein
MSRIRITVKKVKITKAGQVKNFQIKMPKNAIAIIGVDTDLFFDGRLGDIAVIIPAPVLAPAKDAIAIRIAEALPKVGVSSEWNISQNPLAGNIKLQSLEKANIFYSNQVWAVQFNDGIPDITTDLYAFDAFAVLQKKEPRKVDVPANTTIINGMYKDLMGAANKRDIAYTVKVFLWIETDEKEIIEEEKVDVKK